MSESLLRCCSGGGGDVTRLDVFIKNSPMYFFYRKVFITLHILLLCLVSYAVVLAKSGFINRELGGRNVYLIQSGRTGQWPSIVPNATSPPLKTWRPWRSRDRRASTVRWPANWDLSALHFLPIRHCLPPQPRPDPIDKLLCENRTEMGFGKRKKKSN